ncbi:hypothetical protein WSM22_23660 [Cytophagales bacterium WSM2-2]|nr:hypothetical protein WSM22_23660 [Cytophagales bacterium WSM2-2]
MTRFLTAIFLIPTLCLGQTTLERAKSFYNEKKYADAEKSLKLIGEKSGDYAAARYYLGRVSFDKKDYDAAVDYFEEATKANSKESEYFVWLGDTYGSIAQNANVFKQGLLAPKMKKAWENAIALDSKNLNARLSLIQFYLQAPGFMGGSIDKAKEVAKQIMAIKPAEGHQQMASIYVNQKQPVEAEKEYLECMKIDPAYTSALANFYLEQKKYDKAFGLFEDAMKKNPDNYVAIYQMGRAAAVAGQRMDQGEECLKKYLAYQPKPNEPSIARANMRMGQIKEKKGSKPEAKKYFEAALKMDGSLKEAKEGLERCSK